MYHEFIAVGKAFTRNDSAFVHFRSILNNAMFVEYTNNVGDSDEAASDAGDNDKYEHPIFMLLLLCIRLSNNWFCKGPLQIGFFGSDWLPFILP